MGGEDAITQLILEYRYWILIPLTFIEGPIIAFIAGTMAAIGFFNIYLLALLFFVRDVGLDLVYYAIGYYGGRTRFAARMLKRLHITPEHLDEVSKLWQHHAGKTMFIGKLSYGIASAFIVVAGMVRMPLTMFLRWAVIVAVVQYGGLLLLGFFFGNAFGTTITQFLRHIEYLLLGIAVVIVGYYGFSWYLRGKFLKSDEQAQK
jgi:membrane protein DedA with SNARE-associated domain